MSDIASSHIVNLLLFLFLPFVGGIFAMKLKLPRMIGYILAGMLIGISIKGQGQTFFPFAANLGLIFLLFTVGLEARLGSIGKYGSIILKTTALQVVLSWVLFTLGGLFLGFTLIEAVIAGFACSLSSTAIVSRFIQDKGEENSLFGNLSLGVLLLQDFAVIPFLIILSSLGTKAGLGGTLFNIFSSLLKAGLMIGFVFYISKRFLPVLLKKVAGISKELLNLLILVFITTIVLLFSVAGLSPGVAAFVAGVLLSQNIEHYHIFSQVRPFRDLFAVIFFVYLGASIDVVNIATKIPLAFVLAMAVIFSKIILITILFSFQKFHSKTAFMVGAMLSQVGEFAFVTLFQASEVGLIGQEQYTLLVAVTLITIGISPIIMERKERLYIQFRRHVKDLSPSFHSFLNYRVDTQNPQLDVLEHKNHVIICGYGRVGSYVGRALALANIPFIAIDINYHVVLEHKKRGEDIIYGDPTNLDILDFAQAEYASAIVSAVPDGFSQEMIILNAKALNPNITIFSRINLEKSQHRMKDLGAQIVVQPEFEAALSIVRKLFGGYKLDKDDISNKIKRLKIEHGLG